MNTTERLRSYGLVSKGALGLTQLKSAPEGKQVSGGRKQVSRASLALVPLSRPLLMLVCSLVAMTVAEDMPHPDSHSTLLDKGMLPFPHMENPEWLNSRKEMASAGRVCLRQSLYLG